MSGSDLGPVILDVQGLKLGTEEKPILSHPMVGGLILFSRNVQDPEQLSDLVGEIRLIRPDLLLAVDQEGGRVQRLRNGFTAIPPMQALGNVWASDRNLGLQLAHECGWLMASEVLSVGIDISFAPVLDVDDKHSSIIGDRAFSPDPDVVIAVARAFMAGMHEAGMATTGKHYPGHGGVQADSHLELPIDERTYDEVAQRDLRPFLELRGTLDAVMPAHIRFPRIDQDVVGFSRWWLQQVLRKDLGFEGVIFSDDLSMAGAAAGGSYPQRAEKALNAGCDAVLVCNNPDAAVAVVRHLEKLKLPGSGRLAQMRAGKEPVSLGMLKGSERYQQACQALADIR